MQASQAAQEAEDNARKAKNSVNSLLSVINELLDQLGMTVLNTLSAFECFSDAAVPVGGVLLASLTVLCKESNGLLETVFPCFCQGIWFGVCCLFFFLFLISLKALNTEQCSVLLFLQAKDFF